MKKKSNIIDDISIKMMSQNDCENELIKTIAESVSDINMQGRDGRTLLISASVYGCEKTVKKLIESGADIGIKDEMGYTALHAAVSGQHHNIIRFLLSSGADVNAVDSFGNTPLFRASKDDIETIKLLVSFGNDAHVKNSFGISAYDTFAAYSDIIALFDNGNAEQIN